MQLTRQRRRPPAPGLNLASMIDVIFLLLIFFMSTLAFNPPEGVLNSQLAEAGLTPAAEPPDFEPILIRLVAIGESGGPGITIFCDELEMAGLVALRGHLMTRREIADVPVVIQAVGTVPFGSMAAVLDICHAVDLRQVAFSPKVLGE